MKFKLNYKQAGFTIIEMVIVMAIFVLMLPVLTSIMVSVLREQGRVTRLNLVKNNADAAYQYMVEKIRDQAAYIYDYSAPVNLQLDCSSGTKYNIMDSSDTGGPSPIPGYSDQNGQFYFADSSGVRFKFNEDNILGNADKSIIENSDSTGSLTPNFPTPKNLSTNAVRITKLRLIRYCPSTTSRPVIELSFVAEPKGGNNDANFKISLNYKTRIQMRTRGK